MPRKSLGSRLLLYSSLQFVVLSFGAMVFYPGGAMYQPNARHYLFFQNFFSDLGATLTRRHESNVISLVLFVLGLIAIGISLVVASPIWKRVIARQGRAMHFGYAAQMMSTLAGICYVGIAVTPWNLLLGPHMLFVQGAFSLLLGFVICLAVMQFQNDWPRRYLTSNLVYIAILGGYVFILFDGPNLLTLHGLIFQVIAQKVIVYISIINLAYQTLGVIEAESRGAQPAAAVTSLWRQTRSRLWLLPLRTCSKMDFPARQNNALRKHV